MSDVLDRLEKLSPKHRALLQKMLQQQAAPAREPGAIRPRGGGGPAPLSFAQERLWFIDRLEPGSAVYNMPVARRLAGALDAAALERSLSEIVRRHEALRTVFREVDGSPVQVIASYGGFALPVEDLSELIEADREAAVRRRAGEEAARPFDLSAGPLFRAALLRLGAEDHVLLLSMHHIVSDGWSMDVLFRELSALYEAYREGRESPLPELAVQYADYAAWQRERLAGEVLERKLSYWRERLAGAPELLELPADRPRPAVWTHQGASVPVELSLEVLERLQALGRGERATLFMVLLGAFQVLLSKHAGSEDIVVGTPIAGRTRGEVEGLIGFFVNTLVLRTDLGGDPSFREVLRRVRDVTLGAYEHQEVPFEKLVAELRPERSLSRSPLFQAMFALHNADDRGFALPGLGVSGIGAVLEDAKFDLSLMSTATGQGLRVELSYSTDLFERGTAERMLGHLARVLEQVADDADVRVSRLELLGEVERAQVLVEWNETEAPLPDTPVHELFAAQAARTPDAVAVVFGEERLAYAELDARADRLAHALRRRGVGPEVRVGLLLERGAEAVVALLGVLKAGGAYVPLDPDYPAERLAFMLADSGARVLLTRSGLVERLDAEGVETMCLDADDDDSSTPSETAPRVELSPENLAYVIYTSGSTGTPKGVLVPHGGVSNLIGSARESYGTGPRNRVLQAASLSFDASVLEIFLALTSGAALHGADRVTLLAPGALAERIRSAEIDTWVGLPALLDTLPPAEVPTLRTLIIGGDRCGAETAARWAPGRALFNAYAPTEATIYATLHRADGSQAPPIGRPVRNLRAYVLDAAGDPAPVGVPGELYLGGAGVVRGYHARPAMTAERFVPDPFSAEGGARLYRTGDRARWRADGELEFLGRVDHQVKVRGFRVELGEIEAVLRRHEGVADCVVIVEAGEQQRLVAYVVGDARAEALRAHVRRSLPEHMVPSALVSLAALPLTPTGKVDRKALPAPELASAEERYVAPRTRAEEVLAGVWAELLGLERVGVEESFFDLGGHSLLATRVMSRVRELFAIELPLRALFEGPTVAEMAGRVEEMRRAEPTVLPPIEPAARNERLPLSFAQERLWLIDRLEPGSAVYNIPVALRLGGTLDKAALERSLGEIVRRHEALRTVFAEVDGSPVQVIVPFGGFDLPVEDLSALSEADREAAVRRRGGEEAARPFDLSAGPLFRAALLRLGAEDHVLLLSMHHIVSDGWSGGVLFQELSALYAAYREGRTSPLPELTVQYADYAVWQREQLAGEVLDRQLSYWKERLEGAPELLELPTDRPRPAVQTYRGATVPVELSPELLERLQALGRSEDATLYMTLLGAFQVLLSKYSGGEDVVVGSPIAGRTRGEVEGLIGFFVNTLVLRTDLGGDPSFREVLRRVRDVTLGAYEHQEVPFEKLVAELQPERSLSHSPLFQVSFTLHDAEGGEVALPGLRVDGVDAAMEIAKFDLSLTLAATPQGLRGGLNYSTDLFERGTAERMAGHLARVLEEVAADADARLSRLALAGSEERARVVVEWNRTERPYPRGVCIHDLFEAQARARPEAVALAWGEESLSYGELDARANRLARHLMRLGVGPESRVGVLLERSAELVVSILAVLKAGGAYVPLDPGYPAERLRLMLDDSSVGVLLSRGELAGVVEAGGLHVVHLDQATGALAAESAEAPRSGATAENLAYIVYTSGSTGKPKGVMVAHRHVVQLVVETDYVRIRPGDRVAQASNASFDALTFEAWGAFLNGATLVGIPRDVLLSPSALREMLREERITTLYQTTALLNQLSREQPDVFAPLREVLFGGQASDADSVRRLLKAGGPERLLHMYGPTETTAWCSWERVEHVAEDALTVSVGRATGNQRIYLLDSALNPVPVGVPGEAYVGGDGVVRGYLGRPGLTAERFVPDPFAAEPGARMYRTGDRLRWKADGRLEFIGRVDEQVKIRGFRIEPGEIEAVLSAHEAVREARVIVREDQPGEKRLVAYIVGAVEAEGLREHLRESLPEYMVPSAVMVLDALPLTPNGKLDVRALPVPELGSAEKASAAPGTPVEEVLAGIWAEVLGRERVGARESFFELGGHSLLAIRVISRIREVFSVELPLRALFEGPTVAELAGRVEEVRRAELPVPPPVVPTDRAGALPLSFAQERLWVVDQMEGAGALYNVPMAWRLDGALDVEALRGALAAIVRRHEALRTVFREGEGMPRQVIVPFAGFEVPLDDLSGLDGAEREAEAGRRAAEDAARPFDLSAGPLIRARLLRLGGEEHVLLLCVHHVASDGWSMDVLAHELDVLYGAFREGRESPLPELAVQYADYAAWHRRHLSGEVLERYLGYWRETLAGAPERLALPTDHPRPAERTHRGAAEVIELPAALLERLRALGRGEGATLFMVLLGAFQALLSRYGGGEDVVVGSPIAGRTRRELEGLIGYFANTLVLRAGLGGDPAFREVLRRVRAATLGAYEHQELPFDRLVAELRPERSLGHSPLFQVTFTLHDGAPSRRSLPGLRVGAVGTEAPPLAKFDLMLAMEATPGGLRAGLTYATDLFERGTIRRMLGHLERVLEQVAADADLRLSELRLAGEEERALLAAGHATRSFAVAERLDQRFEARALERPHVPALTFEGETLAYGELNERANRLARRLRALGVGPETRVGVALERSAELVVAILAVLKAGGAYVPLDPAYPAERIAFVLEDAGVPVLVTASGLLARLPGFAGAALCIDADAEAIAAESGENPGVEAGPDTLAYVIYTSGSTGRPKGVQVTHANVARLFDATGAWFGFAPDDVWTLFHSFAFDFSVWEIWGALLHGGRLVVVPFLTTRSPEDFHRLLADEGVTMLSQTPSAFKQLARADLASGVDPSALRLRHVVFGGEALDPQSLRPWMERHGDGRPRLVNMYGITETTVHVTYRVITRADLDRGGSPIGVPIPDLSLYLLDSRLEPVPPGVPGELFVGGAGVARGYLNRPELTAERFLRDPFSADPAARLYRSGDLARWRADGELEYLGRADQQVKIRGFRIEPGEIEAALMEVPGVRDAAVLARDEADRETRLVAYVVLHPGEAEDPAALREALSARLPGHMVPAVFVVLPEMPLTANGKLDRRALPAPGAGRTLRPAYAPPASAAERLLQEVWQEVLGAERVGVLESFFAAGGDSIRAVQLAAVLRKRGMALTVRDLFEAPTIRGLAERWDPAAGAGETPEAGAPHHLADLPGEERARVRAAFPAPVQDVYPATGMQAVMLSEYAKDTARAGVYHPQQCHRLTDASLSTGALRHAIEQVVRRHAILRTVFTTASDGTLLQVVRESPSVPIGYQDLRGLSPDERERAVQARLAEDLDTPFDPFDPAGSLMRFVIFHRDDDVADLLISAHHAIEDGWGNVHFVGTLFEAYADARDGRPVSAAPLPNTYRELVALEAEIVASDEARTFWRDRMRRVASPWPTPRGGAGEPARECRVVRDVAPELTAALREAASREGVALKALYLSAFLDVVAALSGGEDACAGVVWNGRSERLSDPLTALGLFWNLVPVGRPATASGGAAGRALAVHHDLLQADRFGRYPLAEIMAGRGGREPFFSTFNFLHFRNWSGRDATVRGGRVEPVYGLDRLHLPFNLAVSLAPHGEGAGLRVEYDPRFFGRGDVTAALESYLLRLEELIRIL